MFINCGFFSKGHYIKSRSGSADLSLWGRIPGAGNGSQADYKQNNYVIQTHKLSQYIATAVLPYVKGLSEQLRRCLQQQSVRAVFKSETTLRSQPVRTKDVVDPAKHDGLVYRIPCECGKVYIEKTGRPMKDRIKEHNRDIRLARTKTSAVSEHAHNP